LVSLAESEDPNCGASISSSLQAFLTFVVGEREKTKIQATWYRRHELGRDESHEDSAQLFVEMITWKGD